MRHAVGTDGRADQVIDRVVERCRERAAGARRDIEDLEELALVVRGEQAQHVGLVAGIALAGGGDEPWPRLRGTLQRGGKDAADAPPARGVGRHDGGLAVSASASHARASAQPRFTVAGDVPVTAATSSIVRPPK